MNEPPPATNYNFSFFFLLLALFVFSVCSCSEDPVSTASVNANLILDWSDETSFPSERLCVFIEVTSNVRRVESFKVKSGDYTWTVDSPIVFESNNRQWVGWSHLEPPPSVDNKKAAFPLGNYKVECVDAAGKKSEASFSIVINAALLETTADQVEGLLLSSQKRIAVFSESNELLYFDKAKDNWLSDDAIFRGVKDSAYYRNSIMSGSALCFMPKKFKNGEKSDGLD